MLAWCLHHVCIGFWLVGKNFKNPHTSTHMGVAMTKVVEEMALIVHGSDPPVAWVAPHLRRGAPRHYALAGARTAAIWSALIDLREWHAQLDEIHDLPPPLEWPTDDDEGPEPPHGDSGL